MTIWEAPRRQFQRLICDYTSRALTNQADALNAIAGLSRRTLPDLLGDLVEGLPSQDIDLFITFTSAMSPLRRRAGFPSYSWAGWIGRISYYRLRSKLFDGSNDTGRSWIKWYQRYSTDRADPLWNVGKPDVGPCDDSLAYLEQQVPTSERDSRQSTPTAWNRLGISEYRRPYTMLQFWTYAIHLRLGEFDVFSAMATILDGQGADCGTVSMDEFEEDDFFIIGSVYEFILLSPFKPLHYSAGDRNQVGAESDQFFVLLLQPKGGVSE
ncbi:hypothetical protein P152DRAFT_66194 [Eremomyces bilateralis CBS 781.70]|uniref:Uncharacterized protein n=1 Tax=Eremomyces bilateralis CBS 781.70 TaxID=1392243 RepID=A0A6G1FZF1_9PEZI|nr:uncharacterized protein P152DRAFT_66194 [Eremomyces bilateralis CBS 781.70]KAF1811227.1 hypothetical protein P152DRAFT_66194 [Eremomyces bilateralis CBS 781.70]